MRIALVTCAEVSDLDAEGKLLAARLRSRGEDVVAAVWDDDAVDWASFDVAVLRSTWDYAERVEEFLAWADRAAAVTRLRNGVDVVRWNVDKRYLADLEAADVPVVPTQFLTPGDAPVIDEGHRYEDVEHVVKPVVSAGSRNTLRLGPHEVDRSRSHAARLLDSGRAVMVQPYLHEVDEHGETALLHLGGGFSHAMRKGPLLTPGMELADGLFLQEQMSLREPSAAEREVAAAALAALPDGLGTDLLYARVDLLPSESGPQVLEVELVEPSLFLEHHPPAVELLADAVVHSPIR